MIKSIEKAIKILEILSDNKKSYYTVSELANNLKADKSSIFRILKTLKNSGYVDQNTKSKEYKLGLGILTLSSRLLKKLKVVTILKPFLQILVDKTGETSHLAVLRKTNVIYVDRIECGEILTISSGVGNTEKIYCSATGKAILSFLDLRDQNEIIENILSEGLIKYTKNTITSEKKLKEEIIKVKERGFAMDNEERYHGVTCIAAPIRDYENEVIASIGISAPISRMIRKKEELLSEVVLGVSRMATEHLKNIHLSFKE